LRNTATRPPWLAPRTKSSSPSLSRSHHATPGPSLDKARMSIGWRCRSLNGVCNDLQRQPMLIRALSRLGPGVAWWDLDSDGDDDLVLGASQGGRVAVFRN